jgi:hypothetical protein
MPKCFATQQYVHYDGTNVSDVQAIAAISGANVRVAPGDPTMLEIYADWLPTRELVTGGVTVTPYLQTYLTLAAFQGDYGLIEG